MITFTIYGILGVLLIVKYAITFDYLIHNVLFYFLCTLNMLKYCMLYMRINELQFANLICVVSTKGCNLVLYSFWNYHDINFERNFCWWISDDEELIKLLKKYKDLEIGGLFFFSRTFRVSYSWLTQNGHKLVNDSTDTR